MITIVDYGAGNLRSVANTLDKVGATYKLTRNADEVRAASKLILPGVGHIGQMMHALDELNLRASLVEQARAGVPLMGICLGMQAMFEASDEAPDVAGLGLFKGRVLRFAADARVPHMGWNDLEATRDSALLRDLGAQPYVYFAHSYYCELGDYTAAACSYAGVRYNAVLEADNVYGVQFHPEKSGPVGLKIVENFVRI